FQAEDGIRDFHVTGVQTCALPISLTFAIFHRSTPVTNRGIQRFKLTDEMGVEVRKEFYISLSRFNGAAAIKKGEAEAPPCNQRSVIHQKSDSKVSSLPFG